MKITVSLGNQGWTDGLTVELSTLPVATEDLANWIKNNNYCIASIQLLLFILISSLLIKFTSQFNS